jgi:hypothetical protein
MKDRARFEADPQSCAESLTRLNAQIQDHDAAVGPSFLIRNLAGTGLQDV